MLFPAMIQSPVVITNSRGLSADTIAEHVLAVVLAMFRKLPLAVRQPALRAVGAGRHDAPDRPSGPSPARAS